MTIKHRIMGLTAAALLGFGATANAQTADEAPGPGYYIAQFELSDAEGIRPYSEQFMPILEQYGGKFIVRGENLEHLEGEEPKSRIIVIEFPSMDAARTWYNSPEYQEIIPIREAAGETDVLIVEGLPK